MRRRDPDLRSVRGPIRWVGLSLSALLLLGISVVEHSPEAAADTLTPPPDAPTVTNIQLSSDTSLDADITPGYPRSSEVYSLSANVVVPKGLDAAHAVQLCFWLPTTNSVTETLNTTEVCDPDTPYDETNEPDSHTVFIANWSWNKDPDGDEQDNVDKSTWTDSFEIQGSNNYQLADSSSTSGYSDITSDTAMTIDFDFQVSHSMRHSNDWNAMVTAFDDFGEGDADLDNQVGSETKEDILVNYFGTVLSDSRTVLEFGALSAEDQPTQVVNSSPLGNYTANSQSDVTLQATAFEASGFTLNLQQSSDGTTTDGQGAFIFRCVEGDSYPGDDASAQVIDSGAAIFQEALSISGIGESNPETDESIGNHSCKLEYTGGADRPNVEYSNTVTVALVADELTAPGNLQASSSSDGESVLVSWDQPIVANDETVTLSNYQIERKLDGGDYALIQTISSGFQNQMSLTDDDDTLGPDTTYTYRLTANYETGEGAGSSTISVTTKNPSSGPAFLQALNDQFNDGTFATVSSVVSGIEAAAGTGDSGIAVFASPVSGSFAENMSSIYGDGDVDREGVFSRAAFYRTGASWYLDQTESFSNPELNGHPYLGFVAFNNSEQYIGSGMMIYDNYGFTNLRNLFYPSSYRSIVAAVINRNSETITTYDGNQSTIFSNNQQPGYYGFHSTTSFSADDGIWGFRAGSSINGNSSYGLSAGSASYGVQNLDGSDTSDTNLYWNGDRYTSDWSLFFFVRYPD